MEETRGQTGKEKKKIGGAGRSMLTIFRHADGVDMVLMILGFIGAVGDGLTLPALLFLGSKLMKNIGGSSNFSSPDLFTHKLNQVLHFLPPSTLGYSATTFWNNVSQFDQVNKLIKLIFSIC